MVKLNTGHRHSRDSKVHKKFLVIENSRDKIYHFQITSNEVVLASLNC